MKTRSVPLEFRELVVGDHFICFPVDGDDLGDGGYRGIFHVCRKTQPCTIDTPWEPDKSNVLRLADGKESRVTPTLMVIKVAISP